MIIEDHRIFARPARPTARIVIKESIQNKGKTMLRRVRREEVQVNNWVRPDPLDYCLDVWREWMCTGGYRNLDSRIMGGLAGDADGHGVSSEEAQHSHDVQIAAATGAMIDSLPRIYMWAIYIGCSVVAARGIPQVWRFPNADLAETAIEARAALLSLLKKNDCTGNLF